MKIIERIKLAQKPLWYHGLFYIDYEKADTVVTAIIPLNIILVCLRNIWYFIKTFGLVSGIGFDLIFHKLFKYKSKLKTNPSTIINHKIL